MHQLDIIKKKQRKAEEKTCKRHQDISEEEKVIQTIQTSTK